MDAENEPFLHLIMHYCNHRLAAREAEYDHCFGQNLDHPAVASVHNLIDPSTRVPEQFRSHPKYVEVVSPGQWMSYQTVFQYANEHFAGKIVATMNLDTYLDDKTTHWGEIPALMDKSIVLCLSRTEYDPDSWPYKDPVFERIAFANTQDAWISRAPFEVPDCDFEIGTLGCDNAIAERIKRTGRIPVNSPNRFRLLHFDQCRKKTSTNQLQVHTAERTGREEKFPEENGQYLLPDIDQLKSVDALLTMFKADEIQRYQVICDVLSQFAKISNRPKT